MAWLEARASRAGYEERNLEASMQILEEHVEWAVMDRLRGLLERTRELGTEHTVTLSLSLVLSIVAWGRQRIGANPIEWGESLRKGLLTPVTRFPWLIPAECLDGDVEAYPNGKRQKGRLVPLRDASAWEFLIFLRNSVAHGDHRNIRPMSEALGQYDPRHRLSGFEISNNCNRITGVARLHEDVLVRFGTAAGRLFCAAYGLNANEQQDAEQGVLEREEQAA